MVSIWDLPAFESKTPCLPVPDLLEELALLGGMKVKVEFQPLRSDYGTARVEVSIKSSTMAIPFARNYWMYQRQELATWLRQVRLHVEMVQAYDAKHPPL